MVLDPFKDVRALVLSKKSTPFYENPLGLLRSTLTLHQPEAYHEHRSRYSQLAPRASQIALWQTQELASSMCWHSRVQNS